MPRPKDPRLKTTIQIVVDTLDDLREQGKSGQTPNDIIEELIAFRKTHQTS